MIVNAYHFKIQPFYSKNFTSRSGAVYTGSMIKSMFKDQPNKFTISPTLIMKYCIFKEKMDEALDILRKMHYLEGCKNIENQFKSLVNKEDKNLWATNFKNYVTEFENSLADFSKPKLVEYLQKIFDEKCNESLAELNKTYEYLLGCLSKYLLIITTYYAHLPDAVLKEVPDLDIVKEASNELLIYSNNIDDLNQAILAVCPFFFIVPNKNSLWKTQLGTYSFYLLEIKQVFKVI